MQTINLPGTATSTTGTIIVPEGSAPTLIRNSDVTFSCTLSNENAIDTTVFGNSVVLSPGGVVVVDGKLPVYGIGNFTTGTIALQVIPGGISFFQRLSSLLLTDPNGSDFILLSTGSPPQIQIATGDVAESSPGKISSLTQGVGPTRQLVTELIANRVTGEAAGAFAVIFMLSPSVDLTIPPQVSIEANDGAGHLGTLNVTPTLITGTVPVSPNNVATPGSGGQAKWYNNNASGQSHLKYVGSDGIDYITGGLVIGGPNNQAISSLVYVPVTGMSQALGIGKYKFKVSVELKANANAGQWFVDLGFSGTATVNHDFMVTSAAGVVSYTANIAAFNTDLTGPATSVLGFYKGVAEGEITVSVAGTLAVNAKTSVAADTFNIFAGSSMEFTPVV